MNRKNLMIIAGISVMVLVVLILSWKGFHKKEIEVIEFEEPISSEETVENTEGSQEAITESAETAYPKPEYDFTTEEVSICIEGIDREYTIAWVSDLHLVSDHEAGDVLGDVHAEYLDAINKRHEELAVTADGIHAEELWPEIVKYLNYHDFDGIIFGGDMMDYCSNANIAMIKEGLDSLHVPYIYSCRS